MGTRLNWQVILASFTIGLVACEESITDIPDPVAGAAPAVEASSSVTLLHGSCVVPGDGLVSWWPGDGNFKDIAEPLTGANDIGFNATDGVRTAQLDDGDVTFEDGMVGQAFSFTSSQGRPVQFLEVADTPDLRPENFTIDMWAQRTGVGQNDDAFGSVLIQKALDDATPAGISYSIWWNGAGKIKARVNFGSATANLESGPDFGEGEWVHIALTVDGSTARLFVNGGEVAAVLDAGGAPVYGGGSVVLGSSFEWARKPSIGFQRGFHGLIDEVDLYDRALLPGEIGAIHAADHAGKCKGGAKSNTAPEVNAGSDGEIDEGSTFTSGGSFTDPDADAWTVTVDYGDGSPVENPTVNDKTFGLSHVYADDGTYEITVTVNDGVDDSAPATASVVVNNVAPTVDFGPDAKILEGGEFIGAGSFTDPGVYDSWTATVNYGDGSGDQPLPLTGTSFHLSHTYAGNGSGPFLVTVTVTDDDGGVDDGTAQVTVIYQISVDKARVGLVGRGVGRDSQAQERFDVEGTLPLSLLERPGDVVTVGIGGLKLEIHRGAIVRRGRGRNGLRRAAGWPTPGIQLFELSDDGRFKIHARSSDLGVHFPGSVEFSISIGPDRGETEIRLDARGRLWTGP